MGKKPAWVKLGEVKAETEVPNAAPNAPSGWKAKPFEKNSVQLGRWWVPSKSTGKVKNHGFFGPGSVTQNVTLVEDSQDLTPLKHLQ